MATRLKLRRDTAATWTAANPILAAGEPGFETDTGKLKLGDGTTAWTSLAYLVSTAKLTPLLNGTYQAVGSAFPVVPHSGFYYGSIGTAGAAAVLTLGTVYAVPFWVPKAVTLDRIGLEVTTLAATSTVRLGIYNDTDGIPTSVLLDAGTIDGTSTGIKEITISQALTPGLYWLASCSQGAAPTLRTVSGTQGSGASGPTIGAPAASLLSTAHVVGYSGATGQTGALPAFGTPTGVTSGAPRMIVRVA